MSFADIARLSIAVDSSNVRTATGDLAKMGIASEAVEGKIGKMCKGIAALIGIQSFGGAIKEVSLLAARYDTLGVSMQVAGKNAGYSSAQMDGYEKALRKTGISALESRQSLITLATSNMDLAQSTKLARAAQDLAVVGNMNSSEAFNRLIHGIQTGNTLTLRSLGLNMEFKDSNKELAKSLGKTVGQLTAQEKQQARVNQVLQQAAQYSGIYEGAMTSAGKKLNSMARYVEDFKVALGAAFQPALAAGVEMMTDRLEKMGTAMERAQQNGDMARWGSQIKGTLEAIGGIVSGTTEFLWKYRSALMAVAVGYGALKTAMGIKELSEWIAKKWQAAQANVHTAAMQKIETSGKLAQTAAIRINTIAQIDEAKQAHFLAIEKNDLMLASGKVTLAEAQEAAAHHANKIAMLDEYRQQVLSNNGKVGFTSTLKAFIGPMGVATIAIGVAAAAWGAYRRSVQEAMEKQEEARRKVREQISAGTDMIASINEQGKALDSLAPKSDARKKAQIEFNHAIGELIKLNPEYSGALRKEGEDYVYNRKELDKLNLSLIENQRIKALEEVNAHNAESVRLEKSNSGWGYFKNLASLALPPGIGEQNKADFIENYLNIFTKDRETEADRLQAHVDDLFRKEQELRSKIKLQDKLDKAGVGKTGAGTALSSSGSGKAAIDKADELKKLMDGLDEELAAFGASTIERYVRQTDRQISEIIEKVGGLTGEELKSIWAVRDAIVEKMEAQEREKQAEKALNEIRHAGLIDEQEMRREQIEALHEKINLLEQEGRLAASVAEEYRKQAEYLVNGAKARAKQLNNSYMTPQDYYDKNKKELDEALESGHLRAGVYEAALADLNAKHLKLKADAGDTWGIIAYTVQQGSQKATDALHDWLRETDEVGFSWKSLGDTVRSVVSGMLDDMARMITQKNVMEPMFNNISGWLGGTGQPMAAGAGNGIARANDGAGEMKDKMDMLNPTIEDTTGLFGSMGDSVTSLLPQIAGFSTNTLMASLGASGLGTASTTAAAGASSLSVSSSLASNAIGAMSGMAWEAAVALAAVAASSGIGGILGAKASGGTVLRGSTYLVGENGPEIFTAPATGNIIPNNQIYDYGNAFAGGGTVNNTNISISIQSDGSSSASASGDDTKLARAMSREMESTARRVLAQEMRQGNMLNPVMGR